METLSSWDEVAPPGGASELGAKAPGTKAAGEREKAKRSNKVKASHDETGAKKGKDIQSDNQQKAYSLGLVPLRADLAPKHPASFQPSPTRFEDGSVEKKKKSYNPGKYIRVSQQSSYDAELFASKFKGTDAEPVVLSKNKLLANEILSPQLNKMNPSVRIINESAPQKKTRAVASPVHETLQDSIDSLVLKQLGLDIYGNKARAAEEKAHKGPKRDAVYNEATQWKSEGSFMKAAKSTDPRLLQILQEVKSPHKSPPVFRNNHLSQNQPSLSNTPQKLTAEAVHQQQEQQHQHQHQHQQHQQQQQAHPHQQWTQVYPHAQKWPQDTHAQAPRQIVDKAPRQIVAQAPAPRHNMSNYGAAILGGGIPPAKVDDKARERVRAWPQESAAALAPQDAASLPWPHAPGAGAAFAQIGEGQEKRCVWGGGHALAAAGGGAPGPRQSYPVSGQSSESSPFNGYMPIPQQLLNNRAASRIPIYQGGYERYAHIHTHAHTHVQYRLVRYPAGTSAYVLCIGAI